MRRRSHAFTIMEMLTIIVIISLLIGLAFPTLQQSRRAGRVAACASNLRQIYSGYRLRQNEVVIGNEDIMLPSKWQNRLLPYVDDEASVYFCPEDQQLPLSTRKGLIGYFLEVINFQGQLIYTMPLQDGPLTLFIEKEGTPESIRNRVSPAVTQSVLDTFEEGAYRLYFEDIRPGGGDLDFNDVVLEVLEMENGSVKITVINESAGYTFNLVTADGTRVWQRMDHNGIVKPGDFIILEDLPGSYGINVSIGQFPASLKNPIFMLDYEIPVANNHWLHIDNWHDWVNQKGQVNFARHFGKMNLIMRDGGVRTMQDLGQYDPSIFANMGEYWAVKDPF